MRLACGLLLLSLCFDVILKHHRRERGQELVFREWVVSGLASVYVFNPILAHFCEWRRMGSGFIPLRVVPQCSQQHLFYFILLIERTKVTLAMTVGEFQARGVII